MSSEPTPAAEPVLVVHHLNNSRSQRILWLLEELNVPYEIKFYKRTPDLRAPKELRAIHPLGKSPVITYGDVTVAESGAIIEYIIRKFGNGAARPPPSGEIHDLYFSHYAEGSLMPLLVNKLIYSLVPEKSPWLLRPIVRTVFTNLDNLYLQPQFNQHIPFIEAHLEQSGDWFAGGEGPTSADYMMTYAVDALVKYFPDQVGPKTKAWAERVKDRPAYKQGFERGARDEKPSLV